MPGWQDKWDLVRPLPGGAQGEVALVKRQNTEEGLTYFLKVLRDSDRRERRERMRREIACYATLEHPRIPRLVDSNIEASEGTGVEPYLVSGYVGGRHLENLVKERGYLDGAAALDIALKLLGTVAYAHSQETVHRDIKPSNIVLRDDEPFEPVLVDFGMSFYEGEERLTPAGQEVGNRFLRLPEFSPNSANKRDPRSDVTLCAGILFYMLTGLSPRNLRDEHGSAPHQSEAGRAALARHTDISLLTLLDVFDRAFDPVIHARWDSAVSLSTALGNIRIGRPEVQPDESPDEMIRHLRSAMERHDEQRLQRRRAQLAYAFLGMRDGVNALAEEIPGLITTQSDATIDPATGRATGTLGVLKGSDSRGFNPTYLIELQGTDLVISLDGVPFFRCRAAEMTATAEAVSSSSRTAFLKGLRQRVGG